MNAYQATTLQVDTKGRCWSSMTEVADTASVEPWPTLNSTPWAFKGVAVTEAPPTTTLAIQQLRPHPDQQLYADTFGHTDANLLREDLRANGQRDPIKVSRDGVIIDGHQRVRLLAELGHDRVMAVVTGDLPRDDRQRRAEFLRHNLARRQLSTLQQARLALRLFEAEQGMDIGQAADPRHWRAVADYFVTLRGCSRRHALRTLRVLLTPAPILTAVDHGLLKMTLAEKVESLPRQEQDQLAVEVEQQVTRIEAAGIQGGSKEVKRLSRDLADLVADAVGSTRGQHGGGRRSFDDLMRALRDFVPVVEPQVDELRPHRIERHLARIARAKALLERLQARAGGNGDVHATDGGISHA